MESHQGNQKNEEGEKETPTTAIQPQTEDKAIKNMPKQNPANDDNYTYFKASCPWGISSVLLGILVSIPLVLLATEQHPHELLWTFGSMIPGVAVLGVGLCLANYKGKQAQREHDLKQQKLKQQLELEQQKLKQQDLKLQKVKVETLNPETAKTEEISPAPATNNNNNKGNEQRLS